METPGSQGAPSPAERRSPPSHTRCAALSHAPVHGTHCPTQLRSGAGGGASAAQLLLVLALRFHSAQTHSWRGGPAPPPPPVQSTSG
jgi:hypothetical protein|eukprot:COSAG01_NODE_3743_length_5743_cov_10.259568_3_plen_87_part_00